MERIKVKQAKRIAGEIEVPPDKSISHRAVMVGAIADGATSIENFLFAEDCICTIDSFKAMGIEIAKTDNVALVNGRGLYGLTKPKAPLYLGNSGTSMRLLLGILAGCDFEATLTGDDSLLKRPMKRVTLPLREMGADIKGKDGANFAPLTIKGKKPLEPLDYTMPIPSAQVKSAILFAGLYAGGRTKVVEPIKSRDHTERILRLFGADIEISGNTICINGGKALKAQNLFIPGDISSAAFFIVAATLLPGSELTIRNIGLNPTRTGIIEILKKMGAVLAISNLRDQDFEPRGDVTVFGSKLNGITIEGEIIPRVIDELPIIMVAASLAKGTTAIRGAKELRVKETDRINSMVVNLRKAGAKIEPTENSVVIEGVDRLRGAVVNSFGDHRTAMSMAVAGILAEGATAIEDTHCIATSFPGFEDILRTVAYFS